MKDSENEKSIFLDAIDLSVAERSKFLDKACRDRPQLRESVEHLLREHERSGFLVDAADTSVATVGMVGKQVGPGTVDSPCVATAIFRRSRR